MNAIVLAAISHYVYGIGMSLTAIFLILIVLVQRGRGGGLSGALGGMGGQSAFGTKAGDMFTRITIAIAGFWLILALTAVRTLGPTEGAFGTSSSSGSRTGLIPPGPEPKSDSQTPANGSNSAEPSSTSNAAPAPITETPAVPSDERETP